MPRKIKLHTEYGGWPIWGVDELANIDPVKLSISQELIDCLNKWQRDYNATLADYPPNSGFIDEEAREDWYREGIKLWIQLQQELGKEYEVYYPFAYKGKGQLFKPDDLPEDLRDKWL